MCLTQPAGAWNHQADLATIAGSVLDCASGATIARVSVSLNRIGTGGRPRTAQTDGSGRFTIPNLTAGRYMLEAVAPGYSAATFGTSYPGEPPRSLDLTGDRQVPNLQWCLWRHGVLTGTVTDDAGDPAVGVRVVALRRMSAGFSAAVSTRTDDHGDYRLANLTPGNFLVAVPARPLAGSKPSGVPTTYFPASSSATDAISVTVGAGEVRTAVDIRLPPEPELRSIVGTIREFPEGRTGQHLHLVPWEARDSSSPIDEFVTPISTEGTFSIHDLPAGRYVVSVVVLPPWGPNDGGVQQSALTVPPASGVRLTPKQPTRWGRAIVDISKADAEHVEVALRDGVRLTGRILFEGISPRPEPMNTRFLVVCPADGKDIGFVPLVPIDNDGVFLTIGLPPGSYELTPWLLDAGWMPWNLKSIQLGSKEVGGRPLDVGMETVPPLTITMTDRATAVMGSVFDVRRQPVPGAIVFAAAAQPELRHRLLWSPSRMAWIRSDMDGHFRIQGLLPGEYLLLAIMPSSSIDSILGDTFERLTNSATKIRIVPGESPSVDLTVRR